MIQDPESNKEISQQLEDFFCFDDPNTTSTFTNWNAHKAFAQGVLIKLNSRLQRLRSEKIKALLTELHTLQSQNQSNPSQYLASKISDLRYTLRETLCTQHDHYMRKLKLNDYANIKAGKLLANCLKIQRTKTRIPHIFHPKTSAKIENPQAIANVFSDY